MWWDLYCKFSPSENRLVFGKVKAYKNCAIFGHSVYFVIVDEKNTDGKVFDGDVGGLMPGLLQSK